MTSGPNSAPNIKNTYDEYPCLHPGVPLDPALLLLSDQADALIDVDVAKYIVRPCTKAGVHSFGDLLRQDMAALRIRPRHKKPLRRALDVWKTKQMRPPTKAETGALFRLAKDSRAAEDLLLADDSAVPSPSGSALKRLLSFTSVAARGATMLDLLRPVALPGSTSTPEGSALGVSLLRTAIGHGNHAMVRLLRDHVTIDAVLAGGRGAGDGLVALGLPTVSAGPLLDALLETALAPAAILAHAVRHWTASAVEALLGRGLQVHHTHVAIAIRRDRDGLIDLFLPGVPTPETTTQAKHSLSLTVAAAA